MGGCRPGSPEKAEVTENRHVTQSENSLPKGYMGRILTVDLADHTFAQSTLDPELCSLFLGGRGLGIALLIRHFVSLQQGGKYRNAFREVDPFSPDNVLIFSTSPATGTGMPASGRFHVNFKSPLTGGVGSANAGGRWAVALKNAGYDVLRITGKSATPVYLAISPEKVEFIDADSLLQQNAEEITDFLVQQSPKGSRHQ